MHVKYVCMKAKNMYATPYRWMLVAREKKNIMHLKTIQKTKYRYIFIAYTMLSNMIYSVNLLNHNEKQQMHSKDNYF